MISCSKPLVIPTSRRPRRNTPPRTISCPNTRKSRRKSDGGLGWLKDYSEFKASVHDASCAYKILNNLRSASNHDHDGSRHSVRDAQEEKDNDVPIQRESVRKSLVDLMPPGSLRSQYSEEEESDDESEVMFALKVSDQSRLIGRRGSRRGSGRGALRSRSRSADRITTASSVASFFEESTVAPEDSAPRRGTRRGAVLRTRSGSTAGVDSSVASFFEDSMVLQSMHIASLYREEAAPAGYPQTVTTAKASPMGDFSQTCLPNLNHDSFQASANFPTVVLPLTTMRTKRPADLRKKRKSMMNWLANRQGVRNLMIPLDPVPPMFVKVIYLPENTLPEPRKEEGPVSSGSLELDSKLDDGAASVHTIM